MRKVICSVGHEYEPQEGHGCRKCERARAKARQRTALGIAAPPVGFEATKVATNARGQVTSVRSVPEATPEAFEPVIPAEHYVKGVSTFLTAGEPTHQWVKTDLKKAENDARRWLALEELVQSRVPPVPLIEGPASVARDLCNVIVFGDPHFGMLAQARETGASNWDMKIAQRVMRDALQLLMQRLPDAGTCKLINIGDFFHFQDPSQLTPRGKHKQDGDGRLAYMAELGTFLSIELTTMAAQKHWQVDKFNVAGNHDPEAARWMNISERIWFRENPRVHIADNAADHLYTTFGSTLIGMYHGHETPINRLAGVLANDRREDWGKAKYTRWVTGHHHTYWAQMFEETLVEKFPTLASLDMFAAGHGYRSERSLNAFTLHAEHGEISRAKVMAAEVGG